MDEKLKMAFGRNLKRLLAERDKTQAELCRRLKVSSATASDWANGKKIPRADKLQSICVWLNCELSDLLEENPKVLPDGQPTEYYDDEVVQAVTDRLERYPEPSARRKVIGKYLESDQLREVISTMDTHTDYQLLTRFLVLSGCRIGEAIALTVKDADMDAHELRIDKTYSLNTNKIQSTKTEMSERTIHMRPELFDLVKTVLHRQKQICLSYGVRTNLLFPWKDGGYMHYVAYSKYFRDHVEKVIGHPLPVHSLRHTYTSLMAEAGIPIETISRQLGHADSSVTREIYMHVTDKMRKADNERLDAVKIL